ncbi:hypothetical protein CC78DRAFT_574357 [Lojkania enalia]|uniref:Uncharacterized protein n=1 Tax=Lojkania enalia TaxID=147567 RepID=A0A9P4NBM9_9PLEO|nr:hypothetical protein CC78DRAFT_574357 [Didymosphaeria enalia]
MPARPDSVNVKPVWTAGVALESKHSGTPGVNSAAVCSIGSSFERVYGQRGYAGGGRLLDTGRGSRERRAGGRAGRRKGGGQRGGRNKLEESSPEGWGLRGVFFDYDTAGSGSNRQVASGDLENEREIGIMHDGRLDGVTHQTRPRQTHAADVGGALARRVASRAARLLACGAEATTGQGRALGGFGVEPSNPQGNPPASRSSRIQAQARCAAQRSTAARGDYTTYPLFFPRARTQHQLALARNNNNRGAHPTPLLQQQQLSGWRAVWGHALVGAITNSETTQERAVSLRLSLLAPTTSCLTWTRRPLPPTSAPSTSRGGTWATATGFRSVMPPSPSDTTATVGLGLSKAALPIDEQSIHTSVVEARVVRETRQSQTFQVGESLGVLDCLSRLQLRTPRQASPTPAWTPTPSLSAIMDVKWPNPPTVPIATVIPPCHSPHRRPHETYRLPCIKQNRNRCTCAPQKHARIVHQA